MSLRYGWESDLGTLITSDRDLKCYHRECAERPVHALLVPVRYKGPTNQEERHLKQSGLAES